jgi:serine/threonine protein kinase
MPPPSHHDGLSDAHHRLFWLDGVADDEATDRTTLASDDDLFSADLSLPPPIDPDTTARVHQALFVVGYVLEERLDDHANSQVYRARRLANDTMVAVKVVTENPRDASSAVPRFRQEARLLMTLHHPGLVRALGHGAVDGIHYLVLELAEGQNLRRVIEDQGPLTVPRAANIAYQAADVLDYVHQQGIVHRDIKPSNYVLAARDQLKLLDLGLARPPEKADPSITVLFNDRLLGTPDFMAPEQALDCHQVDGRADIYSLGCVLYYLLAGRPPLSGKSLIDCVLKHQNTEPMPLGSLRVDIPPELARVCARMMAKKPADRYERAADVAAALAPWVSTGRT